MSTLTAAPAFPFYPARPSQGGMLFKDNCRTFYNHDWIFQPKFNGWRGLLHAPSGTLWNRHGKPLSIAGEFGRAIHHIRMARSRFMMSDFTFAFDHGHQRLEGEEGDWYDVEALERRHWLSQGALIVLDLPVVAKPQGVRSDLLAEMFPPTHLGNTPSPDTAYRPQCITHEEGPQYWDDLQAANRKLGCIFYEGVVAKRRTSLYPHQLRSASEGSFDWIKHRFTTQ